MNNCPCVLCNKEFINYSGLYSHYTSKHSIDKPTIYKYPCSCILCKQLITTSSSLSIHKCDKREYKYVCVNCNIDFLKDGLGYKFCSRKCSATESNKNRKPRSKESRERTSTSINLYNKEKGVNQNTSFKNSVCGEYSKIYFKSCRICLTKFTSKNATRFYCDLCSKIDYDYYRFKFNIYDYPHLFDLEKLNEFGFVSFGGKRGGDPNLNGMSRDHRVSTSEAIKYKYDKYYISHPINCELMHHTENNKKKGKSSITYEELVYQVDEHDKICGETGGN